MYSLEQVQLIIGKKEGGRRGSPRRSMGGVFQVPVNHTFTSMSVLEFRDPMVFL